MKSYLRRATATALMSAVLWLPATAWADPSAEPVAPPTATAEPTPEVSNPPVPTASPSLVASPSRVPTRRIQPRTGVSRGLVYPLTSATPTGPVRVVEQAPAKDTLHDVAVFIDRQPWYLKSAPWFALALGLLITMIGVWGVWSARRERLGQ